MFDKIRNFLFPPPCALCRKPAGRNRSICNRCENTLTFFQSEHRCRLCLMPLPFSTDVCGSCLNAKPCYHKLIACAYYEKALRTTLHHFKFRGRSDLHIPLGNLIADRLIALGETDFDVVIPVPLSKERFKERGYNQAALLAKQIAARLQVPYNTESLLRRKNTKRQSELLKKDRAKNVRNAFTLIKEETTFNKRVLLVDDIFTTGATMREATRMMCNAKRICACTVAVASNPRLRSDADLPEK